MSAFGGKGDVPFCGHMPPPQPKFCHALFVTVCRAETGASWARFDRRCSLKIWARNSFPHRGYQQSVKFSNGMTLTCTSNLYQQWARYPQKLHAQIVSQIKMRLTSTNRGNWTTSSWSARRD